MQNNTDADPAIQAYATRVAKMQEAYTDPQAYKDVLAEAGVSEEDVDIKDAQTITGLVTSYFQELKTSVDSQKKEDELRAQEDCKACVTVRTVQDSPYVAPEPQF